MVDNVELRPRSGSFTPTAVGEGSQAGGSTVGSETIMEDTAGPSRIRHSPARSTGHGGHNVAGGESPRQSSRQSSTLNPASEAVSSARDGPRKEGESRIGSNQPTSAPEPSAVPVPRSASSTSRLKSPESTIPSSQADPPPPTASSGIGISPPSTAVSGPTDTSPKLDLATFPTTVLLKLLASLLQQIATANDALRPEEGEEGEDDEMDGGSAGGKSRGNMAGSVQGKRSRESSLGPHPSPTTALFSQNHRYSGSSTHTPEPSTAASPTPSATSTSTHSQTASTSIHARSQLHDPTRPLFTASITSLSHSSSLLSFHARHIPSISIEAYLLRILKYCPTTNEVFLGLLVYFDRMSRLGTAAGVGGLGTSLGGRGFAIDSYNVHRLVIAGVTVASKFFSDVFYTNSRYAKVGGLPPTELNSLELQFLLLNDFKLIIPLDEMQRYGDRLLGYWEGREEGESGDAGGVAVEESKSVKGEARSEGSGRRVAGDGSGVQNAVQKSAVGAQDAKGKEEKEDVERKMDVDSGEALQDSTVEQTQAPQNQTMAQREEEATRGERIDVDTVAPSAGTPSSPPLRPVEPSNPEIKTPQSVSSLVTSASTPISQLTRSRPTSPTSFTAAFTSGFGTSASAYNNSTEVRVDEDRMTPTSTSIPTTAHSPSSHPWRALHTEAPRPTPAQPVHDSTHGLTAQTPAERERSVAIPDTRPPGQSWSQSQGQVQSQTRSTSRPESGSFGFASRGDEKGVRGWPSGPVQAGIAGGVRSEEVGVVE